MRFVESCPACQNANMIHRPRPSLELNATLARRKGHTVHVDFLGPVATSTAEPGAPASGFKCISVVRDALTRYTQLLGHDAADGEAAAKALRHWCYKHSFPRVLRCDPGSHFNCEKIWAFCEELGIQFAIGVPGHHQGQGLVERSMREITRRLMAELGPRFRHWGEGDNILMLEASLNFTPIQHLGACPFELWTCSPPTFELDLALGLTPEHVSSLKDYQVVAAAMEDLLLLETALDQAASAESAASSGKPLPQFQPGEYVLKLNEQRAHKFQPLSTAVYKVAARLNGDMHSIHKVLRERETERVSAALLKRFVMDRSSEEAAAVRTLNSRTDASGAAEQWGVVEAVVSHRWTGKGTVQFLTSWVGSDKQTWEPARGIRATEAFQRYVKEQHITAKTYMRE